MLANISRDVTATRHDAPPSEEDHMGLYTARLEARISEEADERLRLTVAVRKQKIGRLLDQLLKDHLLTIHELTALIERRNGGDDA
jgi:hypothetical protein